MKVPKYDMTMGDGESKASRGDACGDSVVLKPLKKRIKLSINLTKVQDDGFVETEVAEKGAQLPGSSNVEPTDVTVDPMQPGEDTSSTSVESTNSSEEPLPSSKAKRKRRLFLCQYCQREFWDRQKAFQEHLAAHAQNKLTFCRTCNQGFSRLEDLTGHRAVAHSLHDFHCPECTETFTNPVVRRLFD